MYEKTLKCFKFAPDNFEIKFKNSKTVTCNGLSEARGILLGFRYYIRIKWINFEINFEIRFQMLYPDKGDQVLTIPIRMRL